MRRQVLALMPLLLLLLWSCGGKGGNNNQTPPQVVSITISPTAQSVQVGATQQFTATVSGATNTATTWTVTGPGSISTTGLYTAPASTTTPGSATVTATAQADPTKTASATISIPSVTITVSPGKADTILGATQQFTATIASATDKTATWSASPAGTISTAGLYTAPASLTTPQTITITANANADPSKTVTSTVTIPAVAVTLSPASAKVTNGFVQKFTPTVANATDTSVTWTMTGKGTLDATGQYQAPATVSSSDTATITATSKADTTKSVSATVTLDTISRTVSGYVVMPDADFKSLTVDYIDTASGKLRPAGVQFLNADLYSTPGLVATHPSKPFIYTLEGLTAILGYTFNATGSMNVIPGSPFAAAGLRAEAIYVTPNGKFLYVTNQYGFMWGWSIDQTTGALASLSGSPWTNGIDGHGMIADSTSKHLYAMTAGSYQDCGIGVFSIDSATGALTNIQSITVPGTGRASGIGIDPSGKFLYATGFDNGAIDGFKIDATTGLLTFIPGSPFAGGGYPGEGMVVDPLGTYVFAGNRGGIAMYTISNSTGVLTEVSGSPFFTALGESSDFHVDPTGSTLYTNDDFTMTALRIDRSKNQLTFLNSIHSRTTVGTGRWVRFSMGMAATSNTLASKFAYVLNNQDKTISAYSIDDTSGVPTSLGAAVSTGGVNPQAMAMDWYGNFLYVVNQDSNTVSAFTINQSTGALTAVAGSPFATGPSPTGVAVEATGRVLFVGTSGDDSLAQYTINPTTGALIAAGSTPTGQCNGARSLVADWRGDYLYQICAGSSKVASYALQINTGLLSSTSPHSTAAYGGTNLALGPFGAAPPHSPYWHSFGFLVSPTDRQIKQFIVGNEGELVYASSGPVGPNQALALDPRGNLVYASNALGNNVQGFTIDPSEGTLTEISGSPWSTGVFPIAASMDTTGRFLYVVNRDSNTVSGYMLNFDTGSLMPMDGQTFATGARPVAILITGNMQ